LSWLLASSLASLSPTAANHDVKPAFAPRHTQASKARVNGRSMM
jgi:hypothetical protein